MGKKTCVPFLVLQGNFMNMHEYNIENLAFGKKNATKIITWSAVIFIAKRLVVLLTV